MKCLNLPLEIFPQNDLEILLKIVYYKYNIPLLSFVEV